MKKNYSVTELGTFSGDLAKKGRVMAGETLGLTGCEISFNSLPAGQFIPFVHSHKMNEEVYIVIGGDGRFMADGDEFDITEGTVIRVSPKGERTVKAGDNGITYICIQAKENSLTQATEKDGDILPTKASWMK